MSENSEGERYLGQTARRGAARALFLLAVVGMDMLGHYLDWPWLLQAVSWTVLPAFLLCFPAMNRLVQGTSLVLMGLGVVILLLTGAGAGTWLRALRNQTGVFDLVVIVRLLGLPWELGGYREVLSDFFVRRRHQPRLLYAVAATFAYLMSNVLIVGAVPVTGRMLQETVVASGALPVRFLTRAASIGFVTALFFTPISPLQALGMQATGARWLDVMPLGLLVSLCGLALNIWLGARELPAATAGAVAEEPVDWRRLCLVAAHFMLAMGGMAAAILVGESRVPVPSFYLIALVVIMASFLWALFLGRPGGYLRGVASYATQGIGGNATEFGLLVSAGFLAVALQQLYPETVVQPLLLSLHDVGLGPLIYPLIILLVWGISFTGVHPLALLAIVSGALQTSVDVLYVPAYFVALVAGAGFSYLTSPFSISLLILSGLVGSNTVELGWRWNRPFVIYFALLVLLLTGLAPVLGR